MRPVALVLFSAGSASSIRPSLLPETDPLIHTRAHRDEPRVVADLRKLRGGFYGNPLTPALPFEEIT